MSLGFSVGDFLAAGQLALKIYQSIKDAPDKFAEISRTLSSIHTVLADLTAQAGSSTSLLNRNGSEKKQELLLIIENLTHTMKELEDLHMGFKRMGRNAWRRWRLGQENVAELANRLQTHLALINAFTNGLLLSSNARIESSNAWMQSALGVMIQLQIRQIVREERIGMRAPSLISGYAPNDPEVLSRLEMSLRLGGIPRDDIERNRINIGSIVEEVLSEGAEDNGSEPDDGQSIISYRIHGPPSDEASSRDEKIPNGRPNGDGIRDTGPIAWLQRTLGFTRLDTTTEPEIEDSNALDDIISSVEHDLGPSYRESEPEERSQHEDPQLDSSASFDYQASHQVHNLIPRLTIGHNQDVARRVSILFHSRSSDDLVGPMFIHYLRTLMRKNASLALKIDRLELCCEYGSEYLDISKEDREHNDKVVDFNLLRFRKTKEKDSAEFDYIVTDIPNYFVPYQPFQPFFLGRPPLPLIQRPRGKAVEIQFFPDQLSRWGRFEIQSDTYGSQASERQKMKGFNRAYRGMQMLTHVFLDHHLGFQIEDQNVPSLQKFDRWNKHVVLLSLKHVARLPGYWSSQGHKGLSWN